VKERFNSIDQRLGAAICATLW